MPAKKTKKTRSAKKAAPKTASQALHAAWQTPNKKDGLSFKDTVVVVIIALITFALGCFVGRTYESYHSADLVMKIFQNIDTVNAHRAATTPVTTTTPAVVEVK